MGRFLFGVLCALALFWAYDNYLGGDAGYAAAGDDAPLTVLDSDLVEPAAGQWSPAAVELGDPHPVPAVEGPAHGRDVSSVIAALAAGDPEAGPQAFELLVTLKGPSRDQVVSAVLEAERRAETAEGTLTLLGARNAFLRSPEGRQIAERGLQRISSAGDRTVQFANLSRMFEACMWGKIDPADPAIRATVDRIRDRHAIAARRVAFDPANVTGARRHVVQPGESLDRIARNFRSETGVPMEAWTIAIFNRISNPNVLQADQALKIPTAPLRTVVAKSSFLMAVYCGDDLIRTYWCAHGREGHDTPETTFVVLTKIEDPDWYHEGKVIPFGKPENPLGTHFIKFKHSSYSGFGVHGTTEPESIGTRASLGCIRLGAHDVLDYFRLVPCGTEVEIRA